jgi:hypothetical protein
MITLPRPRRALRRPDAALRAGVCDCRHRTLHVESASIAIPLSSPHPLLPSRALTCAQALRTAELPVIRATAFGEDGEHECWVHGCKRGGAARDIGVLANLQPVK